MGTQTNDSKKLLHNQSEPHDKIQKNQSNKPDGLPDKFWDEKNQTVRVNSLVKSYIALEKKMAQSISQPTDDETHKRFLQAAGVPGSADDYQVTIKDELFEPDPEVNKRLHAKGFTPDQVQEVYDLAAELMVPLVLDLAADFQADREVDRLVEYFGGQNQWREASRQMLVFGQKNLPKEALEGLSSSYEGIIALYNMMQGKEPQAITDVETSSQNAGALELNSMMKDPRYWKDKDPAFIAKVTDGFQNMYGE